MDFGSPRQHLLIDVEDETHHQYYVTISILFHCSLQGIFWSAPCYLWRVTFGLLYIKLCSLSKALNCERLAPTFTTFTIITHGPPSLSLSAYRYKTSWYTHAWLRRSQNTLLGFCTSAHSKFLDGHLSCTCHSSRTQRVDLTEGCRWPGFASHGNGKDGAITEVRCGVCTGIVEPESE